ncbi:MAG TPA: hypothetical protein VHJ17_06705 [Thermomonospora sp.]|nr:hypothetical protein [Thermomonospora sp.]
MTLDTRHSWLSDGPAEAEPSDPPQPEADPAAETGEAPEDDTEPAEKNTEAAEPPSGGRRRWAEVLRGPRLVRGLVLVALAASVVTAVLQWHRADTLSGEDGERNRVRERAAAFGVALLSYDHDDLKTARAKVLSMASDDFAKTYDVAFTGGLEGVIGKLKADATASVRAVYLNDMDATTAKAIVVLDSEVRSSAGVRRVLGSYLEMQLVRKGDDWKVTEVSSVGTANETMTDPKGTPSATPTPTPSPSG